MKKRKVAIYEGHMIGVIKTFTDCVIPIIATLMILEVPLPIALGHGNYSWSETLTALIIFFVSFLVVVGFYFEFVKFFAKIKKISGWHIFAYCIFMMLLSLFPFMTQVESGNHPGIFIVFYIVYVVFISRFSLGIMKSVYRLNDVAMNVKRWNFHWDTTVMAIIAIGFGWIGLSNLTGLVMVYLPVKTLIQTIVFDEEED